MIATVLLARSTEMDWESSFGATRRETPEWAANRDIYTITREG